MRLFFTLFLMTCLSTLSYSQVINVETMRAVTDSAKWTGSVGLNIDVVKNKNNIFKISNKAHVQYNNKKNLWLFVNDLKLEKLEGSSFVNKGTQHLRYNRKISHNIKMEAFLQAQYDAISEIDFRGLAGLGPRFKLYGSDKYRFYLGTLVMYEYEKASDVVEDRIQKDIRGSAYFSFSLYPTDYLAIISTSYYQPKLSSFKDYRLSSESSILFRVYEQLAFKTTFTYNFDAFPVETIPNMQYELTNGLIYTF